VITPRLPTADDLVAAAAFILLIVAAFAGWLS